MSADELLTELRSCFMGSSTSSSPVTRGMDVLERIITLLESRGRPGNQGMEETVLIGLQGMSYGSKDVPLIRKVSEVLAVVSKAMLQRKKITSKGLKLWLSVAKTLVSREDADAITVRRLLRLSKELFDKESPEVSAALGDWCALLLHCLLLHNSADIQQEAHLHLCENRKAIFLQPKLPQQLLSVIKDDLVPQLLKWIEEGNGSFALQVWTMLIKWMGEYLRKNKPLVDALLRVAEKGFASNRPELQCQALESWKVLIDNLPLTSDKLKMSPLLKLAMAPLRTSFSSNAQTRLARLHTLWHLVHCLGPHLSEVFDQVCLPLLTFTSLVFTEKLTGKGKTAAATKKMIAVQQECVYMLIRLLDLDAGSSKIPGTTVPCSSLSCPLELNAISRHLEPCEKSCHGAFVFLQQDQTSGAELCHALAHVIIQRTVQAHTLGNPPVVTTLLKLLTDAVSLYATCSPGNSLTLLKEICKMPERILTSHCYYSGKQGALHGMPILSFLKQMLQPPILAAFTSEEEAVSMFKQMLRLGLKGPSWLHFARVALMELEKWLGGDTTTASPTAASSRTSFQCSGESIPPGSTADTAVATSTPQSSLPAIAVSTAEPTSVARLAGPLWQVLASSLVDCIQGNQEVNQGSDLEPDFTTMVAALGFPVLHVLPGATPQVKKAVLKKWTDLYQSFSCCASLVPSTSDYTACQEVCLRIYRSLAEQLKGDTSYVDSVLDILGTLGNSLPTSISRSSSEGPGILGHSPGSPQWGQKRRKHLPMGELHWYCMLLVWCLEGCHSIHQRLSENTTADTQTQESLAGATCKVARLSQQLFGALRSSQLLQEALELLAKPMAPLIAAIKKSGTPRSYASKVGPKLEGLWAALVGCILSHYVGPRDSALLLLMAPLLEAALLHQRCVIHERAVQLWQALFARPSTSSVGFVVPPSLKATLREVKPSLLPDVSPDEFTSSSPTTASSSQDNSMVPDARLPVTPKKAHNVHFTPNHKKEPPFATLTSFSPGLGHVPRGTGPSKSPAKRRRSLYDMKEGDFVIIQSAVKKPMLLTAHQREVQRERRPIPAMYNNLSQSALSTQDVEETMQSEMEPSSETPPLLDEVLPVNIKPEPQSKPMLSSGESLPVIVLESSDEDTENVEASKLVRDPEPSRVPPLKEVAHNSLPAPGDGELLVPESEEPSPTDWLIKCCKGSVAEVKLHKLDCPGNQCAGCRSPSSPAGSPKVYKPKGRLSVARSAVLSAEQALSFEHDADLVPSSQSGSSTDGQDSHSVVDQAGSQPCCLPDSDVAAANSLEPLRRRGRPPSTKSVRGNQRQLAQRRSSTTGIVETEEVSEEESVRKGEPAVANEQWKEQALFTKHDAELVLSSQSESVTDRQDSPNVVDQAGSQACCLPESDVAAANNSLKPPRRRGRSLATRWVRRNQRQSTRRRLSTTGIVETKEVSEEEAIRKGKQAECFMIQVEEGVLRKVPSGDPKDCTGEETLAKKDCNTSPSGSPRQSGRRRRMSLLALAQEETQVLLGRSRRWSLNCVHPDRSQVDISPQLKTWRGVQLEEGVTPLHDKEKEEKEAKKDAEDMVHATNETPEADNRESQDTEVYDGADIDCENPVLEDDNIGVVSDDLGSQASALQEPRGVILLPLASDTGSEILTDSCANKSEPPSGTPNRLAEFMEHSGDSEASENSSVQVLSTQKQPQNSIQSVSRMKLSDHQPSSSSLVKCAAEIPILPSQGTLGAKKSAVEELGGKKVISEVETSLVLREDDCSVVATPTPKPEDANGVVKGARKRKLPLQTVSPIASRLRAKQDRQIAAAAATQEDKNRVHFLQASQSAHANSAASSPPSLSPPRRDGLSAAPLATGKPPWASSTYLAHSSRSRIMLDAAMRSLPSTGRSLGSSLKQLQASPDAADKQRHGGSGILRRRSEGESPRIIRQGQRHVSFADPIVQAEYEIACNSRGGMTVPCPRVLYDIKEQATSLEKEVIVNSQDPMCPQLEGCKDPLESIVPLMATTPWQRRLCLRLQSQGVQTVGDLAALTPAQVLQLPLSYPKVANLRNCLLAYLQSLGDSPASESVVQSAPEDAATVVGDKLMAAPAQSAEHQDDVAGDGFSEQLTDVQAEQVTPSCDTSLEDDSCSVATCQEAAPVMRDTREAHSQTELESVRDSGVQAAPPVTDLTTQTGEVVLTSSEILPLLTSEFFGTLEREDLSRVLAAIPLTTGGLLSLLPPLTSAEILLQLTPEFFASLRGADLANVLANASRAVAKF